MLAATRFLGTKAVFRQQRPHAAILAFQRRLASNKAEPLKLDYTLQSAGGSDREKAVVVLHGFFGSKRNWGTLSKTLADRLQRPIYALVGVEWFTYLVIFRLFSRTLRNHGTSPHSEVMTYEAMVDDVWKFINENNLSEVSLIGHSMGGKVAMAAALQAGREQPPHTLDNLIVVDVSPIRGRISKQFINYVDTLKEIQDKGLSTRKEASDYLAAIEPDPGVRAFLLTNLMPFDKADPKAKFAVPLNTFKDSIANIGDFPYAPGERTWTGRTLFIRGSQSSYIKEENLSTIAKFFPEYELEVLDTGHWVHAEQPKAFTNVVCNYINTFN
ncbi:mitochondrial protein [Coprinopsis sp. MPI-PUGE-AT-0042]|nr:mitochondrial protein [Coprinopsis sp. MPI-PUGE-AT-0042]